MQTPTSFVEKDFEDFRKMMSDEEVAAWLERLAKELHTTFFDRPLDTLDRDSLARHAHCIVSQAGFMGFSDLARHCSTLEEACAARADISASFAQAGISALAVCRTITALR